MFKIRRDALGRYIKGGKRPDVAGALNHNWGKRHWMGSLNPRWCWGEVNYRTLHRRTERALGKANHCVVCGLDEVPVGKKRYFQWANISGEYRQDTADWVSMCIKCHVAYDGARKGTSQSPKHLANFLRYSYCN